MKEEQLIENANDCDSDISSVGYETDAANCCLVGFDTANGVSSFLQSIWRYFFTAYLDGVAPSRPFMLSYEKWEEMELFIPLV